MFRSLFRPESPLMITMNQITDCIFLSLFWILGCMPVVTIGAATAALYDAVFRCLRRGEKHSWQRFWKSYRDNLKGSILSSVVFVLLGWGLVRGLVLLWNAAAAGSVSMGLFAAGAFVAFVLVGVGSILFPMLSRFENTTAQLWSNTIRLGLGRLPLTLGLAAVNTLSIFLCLRYVFPLFFFPAVGALLSSVFIERMFRPFLQEDPT